MGRLKSTTWLSALSLSKDERILLDEIEQKTSNFLREARKESHGSEDEVVIAKEIRRKLQLILRLPVMARQYPWTVREGDRSFPEYLRSNLQDTPAFWGTLLGWLLTHGLGKVAGRGDFAEKGRVLIGEWKLDRIMVDQLSDSGMERSAALRLVMLVKLLIRHQKWFESDRSGGNRTYAVLDALFKDKEGQEFLGVNQHDGILWFNKESFEELLSWLMLTAIIEIGSGPERLSAEVVEKIEACYEMIRKFQDAEKESDYQVEKLLAAVTEKSMK